MHVVRVRTSSELSTVNSRFRCQQQQAWGHKLSTVSSSFHSQKRSLKQPPTPDSSAHPFISSAPPRARAPSSELKALQEEENDWNFKRAKQTNKKKKKTRTEQQKVVGGSTAKAESEGGKRWRWRFSDERGCGKKWDWNKQLFL